jgi:hypothetical protein
MTLPIVSLPDGQGVVNAAPAPYKFHRAEAHRAFQR